MYKIQKTERLTIRKLMLNDAVFIYELVNTEGWKKYIGERNIKTTADGRQYLLQVPLKSYADHGFGLYAVSLKGTGEPIGICGFLKKEYLHAPDLGFAFLPQFSGYGYACEAAAATLQFGIDILNFREVLATTVPANERSEKLLKKLGFKFLKTISVQSDPLNLFQFRDGVKSKVPN